LANKPPVGRLFMPGPVRPRKVGGQYYLVSSGFAKIEVMKLMMQAGTNKPQIDYYIRHTSGYHDSLTSSA